jgi:hypothetical protein
LASYKIENYRANRIKEKRNRKLIIGRIDKKYSGNQLFLVNSN